MKKSVRYEFFFGKIDFFIHNIKRVEEETYLTVDVTLRQSVVVDQREHIWC